MTEASAMVVHPGGIWQRNPLLATKLYIPPTPARFVLRPQLIERLNEGVQTRLTLLCAPAGFGKTSLLSEWYAWQAEHAAAMLSIAWVSLDGNDNDPVRFWCYVMATLERAQPGIEGTVLSLLESPQPPALELLITTLINAILAFPGKIVLILDDYHAITATSIHEGLIFLLEHLPPQLHIILASRSDPPLSLPRLRSRGQLNELRTDDLRFRSAEMTAFLEKATGLLFSEETVAMLEMRTEGWIAGLNLAALSLKGRTDSASFIKDFAGSHRYILDYLSEEVLRRQPDAIQHFLQQTSILERLSGPLCDAVTGQQGSQALLEQLEQANLFIIPLDDERRWYRYHHLLSDVLLRHLQQTSPERIPELHRRASAWYEQQGFITEAVGHALTAADYEEAARMIEQEATPMLLRGERRTLQQWLQRLPQELLHRRPRLCIVAASLLSSSSVQLEAVEPYLRLAEARLLSEDLTEQVQQMLGEIDGIRANLARHRGDLLQAIALFESALERIPRENAFVRAYICLNLGAALVYCGKIEAARPILYEAVELGQVAGSLYSLMQAFHRLIWMQMTRGRLREANDSCQRAFAFVEAAGEQGKLPHAGVIYVVLGDILREWNELDAAEQALKKGIEGCEQIGELVLLGVGYLYLAHVRLAQGALEEGQALLQTVECVVQHRSRTIPFSSRMPFYQVRLWLAQGKLDLAIQWAQERRSQLDSSLGYLYALEALTRVRVLLAQAREGKSRPDEHPLDEALLVTAQIYQAARADSRGGQVIEALILRALALQGQDKLQAAQKVLQQALTLAEPEGYIRLFVDEGPPMAVLLQRVRESGVATMYVTALLAAFGMQENASPPSVPSMPELLEALSERELGVLRLIAEGRSNDEIARELFLSIGTIKTHLRHIYDKLDVHTRTQAVARARALHLLSS